MNISTLEWLKTTYPPNILPKRTNIIQTYQNCQCHEGSSSRKISPSNRHFSLSTSELRPCTGLRLCLRNISGKCPHVIDHPEVNLAGQSKKDTVQTYRKHSWERGRPAAPPSSHSPPRPHPTHFLKCVQEARSHQQKQHSTKAGFVLGLLVRVLGHFGFGYIW